MFGSGGLGAGIRLHYHNFLPPQAALLTILVPLPDFKVEHPPADAAHSKHYRLNVLCAFDRRKGAASLARWRHGCCTKHVICMAAHAATALVGIGRGRCMALF